MISHAPSGLSEGFGNFQAVRFLVNYFIKVVDHLGNRYKSKAAIAKAYGISKFVFDKREKSGWSLEKVLTTPTDTKNSRLTG